MQSSSDKQTWCSHYVGLTLHRRLAAIAIRLSPSVVYSVEDGGADPVLTSDWDCAHGYVGGARYVVDPDVMHLLLAVRADGSSRLASGVRRYMYTCTLKRVAVACQPTYCQQSQKAKEIYG